MIEHVAAVRGRIVTWDDRRVVQHGMGADRVVLDLDAEWDACDRIQVALACASLEKPVRVIPEGRAFLLPAQMLLVPGQLRMQVIGYEGDSVRLMTEREASPLVVVESGAYDGAVPPEPDQPDLWAKLMADVEAATKAASGAAGAATQAAQAAEAEAKSATDAAAKAESAASSTMEGELQRVAAESSRVEAERSRAAAESAREGAEDKRAASESARTKAETARCASEKARETAEQGRAAATAEAVKKAADAAAKAGEAASAVTAGEQGRVTAEHGRVEAEKARVAADADRAKRTGAAIAGATKAAHDAKTSTDAAVAKAEQATNAAVAKAQTAADSATTAANKAETVVAQLPIPTGNVLKGTGYGTLVNLHDSWKAPILKGKVLGQSNQITTTGKNLINGMESFCKASELPSNLRKYCWGYSLGQSPLKLKQPLKPGTYTYSLYCDSGATVYLSQSPYSGVHEQFVINNKLPNDKMNGLVRHYGTIQLTKESNIVGIYSDYNACCGGMLNEGTKPLPYEPFTGGKPSPSPEYPQELTNLNKAELVIAGKNLINVSKEAVSSQCPTQTNGYKIENGVISFTSISNWGADYIFFNEANVLGVDKLTFSMKTTKAVGASNNNGAKFLCKAFDSQGNEIKVEQGLATKEYEWGYNNYYGAYCQLVPNNTLTITPRPTVAKIRFGVCFSDAQAGTKVEIRDFQIEAASTATAYEPHKSKSTVIDLKGNELCSLPNGVKDEVVIDAEGNVSLIKRLWKFQKRIGDMNNSEAFPGWKFTDNELKENVGAGIDVRINGISSHFKLFFSNTLGAHDGGTLYTTNFKQSELIAKYPDVIVSFIAPKVKPQTIPLGKVELPALPEATSNVWNNGNIPANVYVQYRKDVNIAFADLESKLTQAVVAAVSNI